MGERIGRFGLVAIMAVGVCLNGCGSRAKSVEPGQMPPGEGAGHRGGQNSGDTAVNGQPTPKESGTAPGNTDPNTKR